MGLWDGMYCRIFHYVENLFRVKYLKCSACESEFPNVGQILFRGQGPLCKECLDAEKKYYADCKLDERKGNSHEKQTVLQE